MAENKKGFVIYCDLIKQIDHLTTLEKGQLFEHLLDYVNDKNPTMNDRVLLGTWKPLEQQLKRDLIKYEERAERSRQNGLLGGRPKTQQNPDEPSGLKNNPDEPRKPDTVTVIVKDTVIDNGKVSKNARVSFETFWNLYDKKVDPNKCEPKWNKLNLKDQQAAMEYIPKYKEAEPAKKFRRNPETFLNNRTWENEIIKTRSIKEELDEWVKTK